MSLADKANEDSAAWLTVSFFDPDGDPEAPDSVSYRVDCLTTGNAIRAETSVSPASEIEIVMEASDNAIQDQTNDVERRLVTVVATDSEGRTQKSAFVYVVRNLRKVT